MLIEKQYIQELLDLLDREQVVGNTWVAYTLEPYPAKEIHFFKDEAEVKSFCITATVHGDESVTKDAYFIRKTQDLNLAVLKDTDQHRKDGELSGFSVIGLPVDYNVEAIVVKGIYLPDLKRVIDDTLWHEYKDMGLNLGNRHFSKWWELYGSYDIDRIDREVRTLFEDERTKDIVEQVIGKAYLGYFDRSLLFSDEQRTKIESQLAEYPFAELNDPKTKVEIIEKIGKGDTAWMTLEKGFYPEPEIGQYIVFEHLYPTGMVYEHGHSLRKLNTSPEFSTALQYLQANALTHLEMTNNRVSELLLIGQYRNKELLLDYEGLPESHTGLLIATAWNNGNNIPEIIFNHIPQAPVLLTEGFFVDLDDSGVIRFNDGVNDREIDLSFWKRGDENVSAEVVIQQEQLRIPFTDNLVEKYFEVINSNLKHTTMNVENAQFVKNQVYYKMGLDKQYEADIDRNIQSGVDKFSSKGKYEFYEGDRKLETKLNFKRGNKNEKYFWNSYDATLTAATGLETKQKFYIETLSKENEQGKWEVKTLGFAPKEACNLLDSDHIGNSRAVYKEFYNMKGEPYMAWYKLDLNSLENKNHPLIRYPEYDIKKVIAASGIKENLDDVVNSLNRGNLQAVTTPEGVRQYFAADPANKDVIKYDKNLKLIYQNSQEAKAVNVIPEKNTSEGQDHSNSSEHLSTPANGEQKGVAGPEQSPVGKDKEPLLSTGATNQSHDGKEENQSNENNQEVQSVNVMPEKNTFQGQEQSNSGEQLSTPDNGQQNGVTGAEQSAVDKDKEPLLSTGATNQSQDGNGKNQSKENNQAIDDNKPLIEKGKGKNGAKKNADKSEGPPKNGPSRGKGDDGALLEKNGSPAKKGRGV